MKSSKLLILLTGLTVFLAGLCLYTITLFPGIGGGLDSAEFQISAKILGITHPTGYPFYHLLTHGFSWLPIATLAQRIAFFSALSSALTLLVLFLLTYKITQSPASSLIALFFFAISPGPWNNATIAEVYGLQYLLTVIILYLYIDWLDSQKPSMVVWLGFVLGLSLVHHLLSVFLLAGLIPALLFQRKEAHAVPWGKALIAMCMPLFLLIYFPIRSAMGSHSFDFYTFQSLGEYLVYLSGGSNLGMLRLQPGWILEHGIHEGGLFYIAQYGILPAALTIIGIYSFMAFQRRETAFLLYMLILHMLLAGIWTQADKDAILIPTLLCSTLFLAIGLDALLAALQEWMNNRWIPITLLTVLMLGAVTLQCKSTGQMIGERNAHYNRAYLDATYEKLPTQSILLTPYWEILNLYKYAIWSGEFEDKSLSVYRWNDPRAKAGFNEITGYLRKISPFSIDQYAPADERKIIFLDPVPAEEVPPQVVLIPIETAPNRSIYEARLASQLARENGTDLPLYQSFYEILEWKWNPPVRNHTISGNPLQIDGTPYAEGYGVHGGTILSIAVPEGATMFRASVGVSGDLPEDTVASLQFILRSSEDLLVQSPILRRNDEVFILETMLDGVPDLILEVSGTEDGLMADHAVLANPVFRFQ
ncbi:MAG: DUF2723 domain-containing protein [bacterium]|nr:DUF2723 domain-containing protein [bacterium]